MGVIDKNLFIFDVESTSLFGTGFAFGAIVINHKNEIIDQCAFVSVQGKEKACRWVKENVLPVLEGIPIVRSDSALRYEFFKFYQKHKDTCEFWADVCFPVETNFLNAVHNEYGIDMPYPLLDISTIIDVSIDRFKYKSEYLIPDFGFKTKHNPLDDCKASAYWLIKHYHHCKIV